jgi:hypothetical protein
MADERERFDEAAGKRVFGGSSGRFLKGMGDDSGAAQETWPGGRWREMIIACSVWSAAISRF